MKAEFCQDCRKAIASSSRAGSVTSYFFQHNYCECKSKASRQSPTPEQPSILICASCGKSKPLDRRAGSFSTFLFKELRCSCAGSADKKGLVRRSPTAVRVVQRKKFTERLLKHTSASDSSTVDATFPPGTIIGGAYKIIALLGIGGMGAVYLAEHIALHQKYALKVLAKELVNEQNWLRFQAEAKTLASLNHATFVKVYDLGIHEGSSPFYSMDYLPGRSLEQILIDDGPLEYGHAIDVLLEVLDALAYAHRNGVIHRDIKPGNIMIDAGNDVESVKVLDFGISKFIGPALAAQQNLTSAGEIFGSPFYMSPEQCTGGLVDARSDIYSIGCTLFELLTGFVPFEGSGSVETILMHEEQEVPSLFEVMPGAKFPQSLDRVIAKALAKLPNERYQSAKELAIDLTRIREGKDLLAYAPALALKQRKRKLEKHKAAKAFDVWLPILLAVFALAIAAVTFLLFMSYAYTRANQHQSLNKADTSILKSGTNKETSKISDTRGKSNPTSMIQAWELFAYNLKAGNYKGLICEDKAIFDNGIIKYSLTGPNYDDMTIYSDDGKAYSKISLKLWVKQMMGPKQFIFDKVLPDGDEIIAGLKCQRYKCSGHLLKNVKLKFEATFWTTKQLNITNGLANALAQFSRVPEDYGAPVRLVVHTLSKDFIVPVGTVHSAQSNSTRLLDLFTVRRIAVDSQTFIMPPSGYKKLANHLDLYLVDMIPKYRI